MSSPQRPLANKISALFDYFFTALCVSWDVPDVDRLIAKLQQVRVCGGRLRLFTVHEGGWRRQLSRAAPLTQVTHMVQSMAQARTKQPR